MNFTIATPKKIAEPSNKVRSKQLASSLIFLIFLREPKAFKTKVKDKKSAKSSPTLTEDEETIKLLKL